jgi:hypothetical protein
MKSYQTLPTMAVALACAFGLFLAAPAARAAYTDIKPPDPFNETPEDNHEKILENIYGGNFIKSGVNYSNGSVNVSRIDDSMSNDGVLGMVDGGPGAASDKLWHDGFTDAFAKVRYARDQQSLGYWEGTSGGEYTKLFDISGQGYNVTGGMELHDMTGKTWRWGRSRGRGGIHSSLPTENPDGLDHLVTYKVDGLSDSRGHTVWLLFWEDLNFNPEPDTLTSDRDINDLVIELRAISEIPEPAAGALLIAGFAAAHSLGRRRRKI